MLSENYFSVKNHGTSSQESISDSKAVTHDISHDLRGYLYSFSRTKREKLFNVTQYIGQYPNAVEIIFNCHYVDDYLVSFEEQHGV